MINQNSKIIGLFTDNPILNGWYTTFTALFPNFLLWDRQHKPTYDLLYELSPDLILGNKTDIESIKELQSAASDILPNVVVEPIDLSKYKEAANLAKFYVKQQNIEPQYESDVLFISNSPPTDEYEEIILALSDNYELKFKIIGETRQQVYNHLGSVNLAEINKFLAATKIYIDLNNTMRYNCPYTNTFCLNNTKKKELHITLEKIKYFLDNEQFRHSYIKKERKEIKDKKLTYFHQVAKYFEHIPEIPSIALQYVEGKL